MAGKLPKSKEQEFSRLSFEQDTFELASHFGKCVTWVYDVKRELRRKGIPIGVGPPQSPDLLGEALELGGDAIIIGDAEVPEYMPAVFVKAVSVAQRLGIGRLILNGDFLALDQYATWLRDVPQRTTFVQDLAVGDKLLDEAESVFDEIVFNTGNHDSRLAWKTGGEARLRQFFAKRAPKMKVSDHWWCRLTSAGRKWIIVHQSERGSTRSPLLKPKELAAKYQVNVIANHSHYLETGFDISGNFQAISAGCARDESRTGYKAYRLDGKPAWNPGFAYVYRGYGYVQHASHPLPPWMEQKQRR